MSYHFIDHTADVQFLAEGDTLESAFVESAMALKEAICGDITVLEQETKEFEVKGTSLESLLYKFLEEFIILLDSEDFLVSKVVEIKLDEQNFVLNAKISGDNTDNYKFTNDVKAVTYSEMFVKKEDDKWKIQVVLDV